MSEDVVSRRNLPHWYRPGAAHFVTFRLADSLPRTALDRLAEHKRMWLRQTPAAGQSRRQQRYFIHKQLFALYDDYLDRHGEIDWLANPPVAALVRRSLYHLHGSKYGLLAFCIMPNHAHLLIVPLGVAVPTELPSAFEPGESADKRGPLSSIMHSLKSYTAHEANKLLSRAGQFWQHESYDHWVRDDSELERIVNYINANPVKAGLSARPHEFCWCSAHDRYLSDGDTSGWLGLT